MQNDKVFFIEESGSINLTDKTNMNKATYVGKFNEYIISKSYILKNTLIITDMFSQRDGVDIINSSIDELIFSDCTKKFSEIYSNFIEFQNLDDDSKDAEFKFEVTEAQSNPTQNLIYKFEKDIDIDDEIVRSIKIFINGYDEKSETINLDLENLSEDSRYKYKITSNTIEIVILTHMDAESAKKFLNTFVYKKMDCGIDGIREIYVIINDKISHRVEVKI